MASANIENDEETGRFRRANAYISNGRLSIWEVLGIVSTFRQNVERMKLYKATLSVVRFMAVLNFIYTVVGSAFLLIGLSPKVYQAMELSSNQSTQFLRLGKFVLNYASFRFWKGDFKSFPGI